MKASGSEYVKQRLEQLALPAHQNPKKWKPKKRRPAKDCDLAELEDLIAQSTGPDGEIYGHKD